MGRVSSSASLVFCAAACLGCGGGDEQPVELTPAAWCEQFMQAWCEKNAECVVPSERARQIEDCEFVWQLSVDCTQVRSLGVTHDLCLQSVSRLSCSSYSTTEGFALPSNCQGVLG
jgi:hypothetical protein